MVIEIQPLVLVSSPQAQRDKQFSLETSFRQRRYEDLAKHVGEIIRNFKPRDHIYPGLSIEDSLVADAFISDVHSYLSVGDSASSLRYSLYLDTIKSLKQATYLVRMDLEGLVRVGANRFSRDDLAVPREPEPAHPAGRFDKYRNISPLASLAAEGFISLFESSEVREKLADCKSISELKLLYLIDVNLRYTCQQRAVLEKLGQKSIREAAVYSLLSVEQE